MDYITVFVIGSLLLSTIIVNLFFSRNEQITRIQTSKVFQSNHSELADWFLSKLHNFNNETVYIFAGEFDYNLYNCLMRQKFIDLCKTNNLWFVLLGGPKVSTSDDRKMPRVLQLALENKIELLIRKKKRTIGHGIIGSKTKSICFLEEPHDEFNHADLNVIKNNPSLYHKLYKKVRYLKSISTNIREMGLSEEELRSTILATEDEIKKYAQDFPIKDDIRIKQDIILTEPQENNFKEIRRLSWLATIA